MVFFSLDRNEDTNNEFVDEWVRNNLSYTVIILVLDLSTSFMKSKTRLYALGSVRDAEHN